MRIIGDIMLIVSLLLCFLRIPRYVWILTNDTGEGSYWGPNDEQDAFHQRVAYVLHALFKLQGVC